MTAVLSNTDAVLLAVPMVGLLFVGYFRLDEFFGKSRTKVEPRKKKLGVDKRGRQIYTDPDGQIFKPRRKRQM
jgi:hypothetical protein